MRHLARLKQLLLISSAIVPLLALGGALSAEDKKDEKGCLDCHKEYYDRLKGEYNHEPFKDKDCGACHIYHGFQNRQMLIGDIVDICTGCHTIVEGLPEDDVHAPILDENACIECHHPHSADNEYLLRKSGSGLCLECHDEPPTPGKGVHVPYAEKQCLSCHNPHGSLFVGNMQMPPGFMCASCHDAILSGQSPSDMHSAGDLSSCEQCHEAHESSVSPLLKKEITPLCLGCHQNLGRQIAEQKKHSALEEDCVICHRPHFIKGENHLVDAQRSLCFSCHSEVETRAGLSNKHEVTEEEDCTFCHDPHTGSVQESQPDLCIQCHDAEDSAFAGSHAGLSPSGCTPCHDPHGSDQEFLLRSQQHLPFSERECSACHEDGQSPDELRSVEVCLTCHDEPDPVENHAPDLVQDQLCVDCHNPHLLSVQ